MHAGFIVSVGAFANAKEAGIWAFLQSGSQDTKYDKRNSKAER